MRLFSLNIQYIFCTVFFYSTLMRLKPARQNIPNKYNAKIFRAHRRHTEKGGMKKLETQELFYFIMERLVCRLN